MIYICLLPLIPVRKKPDHKSEMVSQIVFGEKIELLNTEGNWIEVRNSFDQYTGWTEARSIVVSNEKPAKNFVTSAPLSIIERKNEKIIIPAGSEISQPDQEGHFLLGGQQFRLTDPGAIQNKRTITETAKEFLNAPYLWGGRTVMGIDCSGFTQLVYKIHGIKLPRDAYQQANIGKEIKSVDDSLPGDLMFFHTGTGKITHVGIYTGKNQIIHASVSVHIDTVDNQGIFNNSLNEYTHSLSVIKRL